MINLQTNPPNTIGIWKLIDAAGRFVQADVVEASFQSIRLGQNTLFFYHKTACQAATESVTNVLVSVFVVTNLQQIEISGPDSLELPMWLEGLFDAVAISGDIGLLTSLVFSLHSIFSGLGEASQHVQHFSRHEGAEANSIPALTPAISVSWAHLLEVLSFCVTLVAATDCYHDYPMRIYGAWAAVTFASFLPVVGSSWDSWLDSPGIAVLLAIFWPVCPLAWIWPWKQPFTDNGFGAFFGIRCIFTWLFWSVTIYTGAVDFEFRDGAQQLLHNPASLIRPAIYTIGIVASLLLPPVLYFAHRAAAAPEAKSEQRAYTSLLSCS